MTIQQTIKIPADRRVYVDLPETWTGDSVTVVIFSVDEVSAAVADAKVDAIETSPPKPRNEPQGCKFWQDRVHPIKDPLAWLDAHGPFNVPTVDEFLAERHAENEREEAKMEQSRPPRNLRELRGVCKGMDTMDAYFERKRADKLIEDEHERRWHSV
jgi:hypothetical protein